MRNIRLASIRKEKKASLCYLQNQNDEKRLWQGIIRLGKFTYQSNISQLPPTLQDSAVINNDFISIFGNSKNYDSAILQYINT